MHFCSKLLKKEPKESGKSPAMIVFCAFDQIPSVVEYGKQYGFLKYFPLFFCIGINCRSSATAGRWIPKLEK